VSVEPISVEAHWGYTFNLSVEIPDSTVINVGTSENPVAGMMPVLRWTIITPIKESQGRCMHYLQGDGLQREVGACVNGYKDGVANALSKALKSGFQ
jgi:hypothetical protein